MSTIFKLLIKNTISLSIAEAVYMVCGFLSNILIARYLGASDFGQWAFAFAFLTLFLVFMDAGLSPLMIREIAQNKENAKKFLSNSLALKILLSMGTILLIFLINQFSGKPQIVKTLIYLVTFYFIFNSASEFFRSVFRGYEKMKFEGFFKIFQSILVLGLIIAVIKFNYGIVSLMQVHLFSSLLTLLLTIWFISKKFIKFSIEIDWNYCKTILKIAYPFALSSVFILIYYFIDTVMLSYLKGDQVTGWYSAAYKILLVFNAWAYLVYNVTYPTLSRLFKNNLDNFLKLCSVVSKIIMGIGLPIIVGAFVLAPYFIPLLLGEQFAMSIIIFQILIWSIPFLFFETTFSIGLQASGLQKEFMKATACGAIFNIVANLILIPYFSFYGAAVATVLTQILITIFVYFKFTKKYKFNWKEHLPTTILASVISGIILFVLIKIFNLWITIFAGIAVYIFTFYLIQKINKTDYKQLINTFNEHK